MTNVFVKILFRSSLLAKFAARRNNSLEKKNAFSSAVQLFALLGFMNT